MVAKFCLLGTFQLRLFVRRTDFFICLSCDIILVQYFDHKWIYCPSTIFECPFKLGFSFLIYCLDLLKGKKHLWQLQFKKCIQLCAFFLLKDIFVHRKMNERLNKKVKQLKICFLFTLSRYGCAFDLINQ